MRVAFDENIIIKDLVERYPEVIGTLEKHHIDYCCGGSCKLIDGANRASSNLYQLINDLNEVIAGKIKEQDDHGQNVRILQESTVPVLIDYIEKHHHSYVKETMPQIRTLMNKVFLVHGTKYNDLIPSLSQLVNRLLDDLEPHLFKEENILFPYMRELQHYLEKGLPKPVYHCGSVMNPINQMEFEHDAAGDILKHIYSVTHHFALPQDACKTFQELYRLLQTFLEDLKIHIYLENNLLFPKAIDLENSFLH